MFLGEVGVMQRSEWRCHHAGNEAWRVQSVRP